MMMPVDLWQFERDAWARGFQYVAGVDEAGRGPLAGPVVAAAVVLPDTAAVAGVDDSKKVTTARRERLLAVIYREALTIGLGIVDPPAIDRVNILKAALLAMAMAVANLRPQPDLLLIDGPHGIAEGIAQTPIAKGDRRSVSIAAASIVAKVSRDRLMHRYDAEFPEFGFARHKGYPTAAHKRALACHGPCAIHRLSFRGTIQGDAPPAGSGS